MDPGTISTASAIADSLADGSGAWLAGLSSTAGAVDAGACSASAVEVDAGGDDEHMAVVKTTKTIMTGSNSSLVPVCNTRRFPAAAFFIFTSPVRPYRLQCTVE
jgi:hypothetical protein